MKAVFFIFALCLSVNTSATALEVVTCVQRLSGVLADAHRAKACKGAENALEVVTCIQRLSGVLADAHRAEACSDMKK